MNNQSKIVNHKSKIVNRKSKIDWLILLPLIFLPRLLHLNVFLTADEPLFLEQARDFAAGLSSGDFSRTLGIGYPGVTVAWWSAPVVNLLPGELGAYTAGRLATALVTGGLLLGLYALAKRLLGRGPAFLGVGLLALDPYTLSYSRLFHLEAPLALFISLSGVAWLLWLRERDRRWLLLTGLCTGLALLTKSTALLLGPMLMVMSGGWLWTTGQSREQQVWLSILAALFKVALIAIFTFVALWPAMWTMPGPALNLTFSKLFTDQEAGAGNLGLFWFGRFVEDPGPAFYPVVFLLKATPWLILGLLLSLWSLIRNPVLHKSLTKNQDSPAPDTQPTIRNPHDHPSPSPIQNSKFEIRNSKFPLSLPLWLFALTYLLCMTLASKKSVRYLLPTFPVFYLLAGIALEGWNASRGGLERFAWRVGTLRVEGWNASRGGLERFAWRVGKLLHSSTRSAPLLQPSILFLLALTFLPFYHPYYLTYYNPALLGWRWGPDTVLVGWGEGLDQAAAYLKQQPPATVSAWYEWLFPILYQGPVKGVIPQENLLTSDHTVLYLNQVQRDIPSPNIIHYFRTRRQPEYTVRLAGIEYAWVYPGPVVSLTRPDPAPQYPLGGEFGGEARLLGYDLNSQPRSGEPLLVTLYWRILAAPTTNRFVYLRLVDAQGRIWAKADSPPLMGLWPVNRWQPGLLLEDTQALIIPPGTPPSQYRLEVGLYDPTSGQTLAASGQSLGQGGGLLLGEVKVEWQALAVESDLPHKAEMRLAPNALLLGYTTPLTQATTGEALSLELAWRESTLLLARLFEPYNDLVLFEWRDVQGQSVAEQLDELPLPIAHWGRDALLRSQHEVIVPPTLTGGDYELWVMLHNGSDPAGEAFRLGVVTVTAPPHHFELPNAATPFIENIHLEKISLAGYKLNYQKTALELTLYWQTEAPLTTRYKVFAQLLAADDTLLAQADSFPAAGQRPTTGWLPGEIISDPHILSLSSATPPGPYRLITGLYDPLTGQRLPALNQAGDSSVDFITLTEVTLP